MKNILYVTTSYLLKNNSASLRNNSLVKGLIELGYNVDVYTVKWPDELLSSYFVKENIGNIYYSELPNLKMIAGVKSTLKRSDNTFVLALKRVLKQILFFPDECYQWPRLLNYKAVENYDCIITSSDLKSSHFIGLSLKRRFPNIRWIQIWGDPWSSDVNTFTFMKFITAYYEKKILTKGDKIVYVSSVTKDVMANKYSSLKSKIFYIPRGYYIEDKSQCKLNDDNILHIAYTGLISSGRNIFYLLDALDKVSMRLRHRIVIDLYGNFSEKDLRKLKDYSSANVYGSVDFEEMQNVYDSSSMLLYLSNKKGATQIPGKLYDYMGTTKPILCLVEDDNDAISIFLKKFDRCLVLRNNFETIVKSINLIINFSERRFPVNKEFAPINIARSFIDLLDSDVV